MLPSLQHEQSLIPTARPVWLGLSGSRTRERSMPPDRSPHCAVIAAGVVGVSAGYALARRGMSVDLIERDAGAGRRTSYANGAQLSYAYTDTLGCPSLLAKLPRLIVGLDPSIRLKPSFDLEFLA